MTKLRVKPLEWDVDGRNLSAIDPTDAPQVNETPKSEHDHDDALTALPADVARVVEEAGNLLEPLTSPVAPYEHLSKSVQYNLAVPVNIGKLVDAANTIRALIALATAQADYEARILSALDLTHDPAVQSLVEAAREVYRISERDHVAWRKLSEALAAFDKT